MENKDEYNKMAVRLKEFGANTNLLEAKMESAGVRIDSRHAVESRSLSFIQTRYTTAMSKSV